MRLTQAQLGILAFGIPPHETNKAQQLITKFESGRQEPKASELYNLSKTLKKDLRLFFK